MKRTYTNWEQAQRAVEALETLNIDYKLIRESMPAIDMSSRIPKPHYSYVYTFEIKVGDCECPANNE